MIKASDFKKGGVVKIDGEPHVVETIAVQKPAARGTGTLYKVRFRNVTTKRKMDQAFRGDDVLPEADLGRNPVQVLYGDAETFTFMDLKDYSQFTLTKEDIEDEWPYLFEGMEDLTALVSEGRVIGSPGVGGRAVRRTPVPSPEDKSVLLPVRSRVSDEWVFHDRFAEHRPAVTRARRGGISFFRP